MTVQDINKGCKKAPVTRTINPTVLTKRPYWWIKVPPEEEVEIRLDAGYGRTPYNLD